MGQKGCRRRQSPRQKPGVAKEAVSGSWGLQDEEDGARQMTGWGRSPMQGKRQSGTTARQGKESGDNQGD